MEVLSSGEVKLSRTLPQFRYHCSTESTNHTVYKDSEHLGYLVAESMARQEQCLVFCATKEWCEKACLFLTK
jgi:replicative superfamily II helicase